MTDGLSTTDRSRHWDGRYQNGSANVSWYQTQPKMSLQLIDRLGLTPETAVVDVGGGASFLADELIGRGFSDITVVDVSQKALTEVETRIGDAVNTVCADILSGWSGTKQFGLWHDRAVFHFFVDASERARYRSQLQKLLAPGAFVVIATFANDGPTECSALPVARYDAAALMTELGNGFELVATEREEHRTPWDSIQPFTWIAARKDS